MRQSKFFLSLLLLAILTSSACALCISKRGRQRILVDMRHRCKRMGISPYVSSCLLAYARSVKSVPSRVQHGKQCYQKTALLARVKKAIRDCYPKSISRVLKRNMGKTKLAKKIGGRKGNIFSGFSTLSCSCGSGCHFCCILRSIAGSDVCPSCPHGFRCK